MGCDGHMSYIQSSKFQLSIMYRVKFVMNGCLSMIVYQKSCEKQRWNNGNSE